MLKNEKLKNTLNRIKVEYFKRSAFYLFFIRVGLLAILWLVFYWLASSFLPLRNFILDVLIPPFERSITLFSHWLLDIFGYEAISYGNVVQIINTRGISIEMGCWAIDLMALFAGFIIACPGKILSKAWYIASGVVLIHILNIIRIASLCVVQSCCPKYLDFNHHILFKAIVYICIFIFWVIWIKYFVKVEAREE
jgi:exosortase/archaeosortase family protein